MSTKTYWQIDAFSAEPLKGNAAAIVFDADDLEPKQMQAIARETNLSETVFLLAPRDPSADLAVRIFTPKSEIPFGGHPMLAAAFAFADHSGASGQKVAPFYTIECDAGLIRVDVDDFAERRLAVHQLSPCYEVADLDRAAQAALLGLSTADMTGHAPEIVSTGVRWLLIPVSTAAAIARILPALEQISDMSRQLAVDGVIAFAVQPAGSATRVKLRTFAPIQGISEDPVCGSGNGAVGAYIHKHGLIENNGVLTYRSEQGVELGRPGEVEITLKLSDAGLDVKVGGPVTVFAKGQMFLSPTQDVGK